MTITTRRTIIEIMLGSHVYLKAGRYEMFLDLGREPLDQRISFGRKAQ